MMFISVATQGDSARRAAPTKGVGFAAALIVSLLAALPQTARAQQPVFFDGFLADNGAIPAQNFNAFFLWNVTDGSVDLVEDATNPDVLNRRFVDLDGSTNDAGRFATRLPITLAAGTTYILRFDYNSVDGSANAATVSLGSDITYSITGSSQSFTAFEQTFTPTTAINESLVFQDLGNDNAGIGIDNVTVLPVTVAVPEPGTLALAGVALPVLGLVVARRRRTRTI